MGAGPLISFFLSNAMKLHDIVVAYFCLQESFARLDEGVHLSVVIVKFWFQVFLKNKYFISILVLN